jgi:hypothetical protein
MIKFEMTKIEPITFRVCATLASTKSTTLDITNQ